MFDKIKKFYQLKREAEKIKSSLGQKKVIGQSRDGVIRVVLDGNQNVLEVKIEKDLDRKLLEKDLKECLEDLFLKLRHLLANEFKNFIF